MDSNAVASLRILLIFLNNYSQGIVFLRPCNGIFVWEEEIV